MTEPRTGASHGEAATSGRPLLSPLAAMDRRLHGAQARLTGGVSPIAIGNALLDWSAHFANAPFRQIELAIDGVAQVGRMGQAFLGEQTIAPAADDRRFAAPGWQDMPYRMVMQGFLLAQQWTQNVVTGLPGVSPGNQRIVRHLVDSCMDMASPANIPWLNPQVVAETWATGGTNLANGFQNVLADVQNARSNSDEGDSRFVPGKDVAITPGKVVFRNALIELIQYAATTDTVRAEPVLITPAWIMKYYILDLSPHNSLIRYLTQQGHTVFCISWRNPGAEMADTPFDAYRSDGLMAAIDVVAGICPDTRIHACGYCLGGTLLAIAAAAMARDGDRRLASISLLAAQTDFDEAGELKLFTTEAQVAFLEDLMAVEGYLDGAQMAGAFTLLRSRDMIWSRLLNVYWLGKTDNPNDVMAWNADTTRLPARMHGEYLRAMYLRDDLAEGRYEVDGSPVSIADIDVPFFVVGTETDHVAPWHSVYKIHLLNRGDITFVLTSGGHNAGIISEPGHRHRHFRAATRSSGGSYLGPDEWLAQSDEIDGSWWPAWEAWLADHSSARKHAPPVPHATDLGSAPGQYVLAR